MASFWKNHFNWFTLFFFLFRRSKSRSISRHKSHRTKTSKRSRTPEKHRSKRSQSRDRSARSRSKSYIREYTSKPRKRSSESCSSGSSVSLKSERISKVVKSSGNGDLKQKNKISLSSSLDTKVLDEINSDSFSPKQFASSKSKKLPDNIVIDLKKQTIKVPEVEPVEPDGIFHHNVGWFASFCGFDQSLFLQLFLNEEARMEKWVKELFSYRQKALQQGLKSSH